MHGPWRVLSMWSYWLCAYVVPWAFWGWASEAVEIWGTRWAWVGLALLGLGVLELLVSWLEPSNTLICFLDCSLNTYSITIPFPQKLRLMALLEEDFLTGGYNELWDSQIYKQPLHGGSSPILTCHPEISWYHIKYLLSAVLNNMMVRSSLNPCKALLDQIQELSCVRELEWLFII